MWSSVFGPNKSSDTVDHQILLSKLLHWRMVCLEIRFNVFVPVSLTANSVHLVEMRCLTSCQKITRWLRVSILGPLLFVIDINDLPSILECYCPYLYADDTVIYCCGSYSQELSDKLNRHLLAEAKWLNDHKLTLNLEKIKCVI